MAPGDGLILEGAKTVVIDSEGDVIAHIAPGGWDCLGAPSLEAARTLATEAIDGTATAVGGRDALDAYKDGEISLEREKEVGGEGWDIPDWVILPD